MSNRFAGQLIQESGFIACPLADKIMEKIVFQTTLEMNGEERTEQLSAR